MEPSSNNRRIGLLAGWGDFPVSVAQALVAQGYEVYCLGIKGHADERLRDLCADFRYIGIARLGGQIRYFVRCGVEQATMAGKIFKAKLMYGRLGWFWHFPDWRCLRTFYPHFVAGSRDRRDDTLLEAFVNAYAKDHIMFAPATDFAPELLIQEGQHSGPRVTRAQQQDIDFGWRIAKEIGRLDIGQTVALKGQNILAIEAAEGTDACIRRAGELCRQGGFTVVKVAKPQQDMRFDVPTIGVGTIRSLVEAGAAVLAVEARKTILVGQDEAIELANRHGLVVVAIAAD